MSARSLKVRFTVEYETTISVDQDENVSDTLADIDIPERPGCEYVSNTFDVQVEWQGDDDNDD